MKFLISLRQIGTKTLGLILSAVIQLPSFVRQPLLQWCASADFLLCVQQTLLHQREETNKLLQISI